MSIEETVAAGRGVSGGPVRQKILIVTDDVLTTVMAGPAIRAWQIATALAPAHDVTLATTSPTCERSSEVFTTEACGPERFEELEAWCDVVIFQGFVLNHVPALRRSAKIMLVDLYDPVHLEALELSRGQSPEERQINTASPVRVLEEQIRRGDFFVCASEKQRDLWLGFLSAVGRINPATYDDDPSLRRLIDIAPFGLPEDPPVHNHQALKGVVPGIGPDDEVVLWGGGVYDWFDPLTAIRAIDRLKERRPSIRLYFLGVRHPNPAIVESRTLTATRQLAEDLGLLGKHVFFNEGWTLYEERHNVLLEADIAISLHVEHIEAAYSFRTRILDYIWAGLPIVATKGDGFAEIIDREGLGRVVEGEDIDGVTDVIESLLDDPAARQRCRERSSGVAAQYRWSQVLRPIVDFCAAPHRAADLPTFPAPPEPVPTEERLASPAPAPRFERAWRAGAHHYRAGGLPAVMRAGVAKVARRTGLYPVRRS